MGAPYQGPVSDHQGGQKELVFLELSAEGTTDVRGTRLAIGALMPGYSSTPRVDLLSDSASAAMPLLHRYLPARLSPLLLLAPLLGCAGATEPSAQGDSDSAGGSAAASGSAPIGGRAGAGQGGKPAEPSGGGSAGQGGSGGSAPSSGTAGTAGSTGGMSPIVQPVGTSYPAPPGAGSGTTYHVAVSGNDSNSGLAPDAAFRTPQRAVDGAEPGDVILVHGGDFTGFVVRSSSFGSGEQWITMRAADGETPIIRGTGSGPTVYFYASSCDEDLEWTSGTCDRARWRLEGLTLRGSASGGADGNVVKIDTPDVQLVGNKLCCSAADVIKNVRTADDTVIVGNEIWQDSAITAPSGNAQGIDITGADRLLVARNYLHDLSDVGMYAKGNARETRFDGNLLMNTGTSGDGNAIMCGQSTDAERLVDGDFETYGCIASNNIVIGSAGACVAVGSSQGARIAHNTCIDTAKQTHAAIYLTNESEIETETEDLEIVGNIIYQVASRPVFQDTSSGAVSDWSSVLIDGNLFFASKGDPSFSLREGGLDDGAPLSTWRQAFESLGGRGSVFLVGDPRFSGPVSTREGLALSAASPGLDAVDCPAYVTVDHFGISRSSRCDMGALERSAE